MKKNNEEFGSTTRKKNMENRRRHYRHQFPATDRLQVTLKSVDSPAQIKGTIVDLSIGGMRVESGDLKLSENDRWMAEFHLETAPHPMRMHTERVYAHDNHACGFRFLPPINLNLREDQERQIWKFLLEQQRGERRRIQGEQRAAG